MKVRKPLLGLLLVLILLICSSFAFAELSSLPSDLQSIEEEAFQDDYMLEKVILPDNLMSVSPDAFPADTILYAAIGSSSAKALGEAGRSFRVEGLPYQFMYQNDKLVLQKADAEITVAEIPQGVDIIGDEAFFGCYALTKAVIPEGVTKIGVKAFWFCDLLTEVSLPDSVEIIDEMAFDACFALKDISLPRNLIFLGDSAFESCESIESIMIPNGVSVIYPDTFLNCVKLKNLVLPGNIVRIESSAFQSCKSLTTLILPEDLTYIGFGAFYGCESLVRVKIPKRVGVIDEYAFANCDELGFLYLENGVKTIKGNAFYNCQELGIIMLPPSVTAIENNAFLCCAGIGTIYAQMDSCAWNWAIDEGLEDKLYPWNGYSAISNKIRISGIITLENGSPVSNVFVTLENRNSTALDDYGMAISDSDGKWSMYVNHGAQYHVCYTSDRYDVTGSEEMIYAEAGVSLTATAAIRAEQTGEISFFMRQNGSLVDTIKVGTKVDFEVHASGAEYVRLVVDGIIYEAHNVTNGEAYFSRLIASAGNGTRAFQIQAYNETDDWLGISEAQLICVTKKDTPLSTPEILVPSGIYLGESLIVEWNAVDHAAQYTVFVYGPGGTRLWPLWDGDDTSVSELSYPVPFTAFPVAGEYTIKVVASGPEYESSIGSAKLIVNGIEEEEEPEAPDGCVVRGYIITAADMEQDLNYLETVVEQAALILQQSGCETNNLHVLRSLRRYQLDSVFSNIVTDDDDRTYIFLIGHSRLEKDNDYGAIRFDDDEYLAEQCALFWAAHPTESFDFLQMYLKKEDLYDYLFPIRGEVIVFLGGCGSGAYIDDENTFSSDVNPLLSLDDERYSFIAGAAVGETAKYSEEFGSFMLHTILEKCFMNSIADVNTNDSGILLSELRQKVKTAIIDNHAENQRSMVYWGNDQNVVFPKER